MPEDEAIDSIAIPALLRASRGAYGHAVRHRLVAAGFADVPRNGAYVLGGMANHGGMADQLVRELGVSAQTAAQLVDTLVVRGYLQRLPLPGDARRLEIALTDRGRAAAVAVSAGVAEVDRRLSEMITPDELSGFRLGLVALCDIRDGYEEAREASAP